MQPPRGTRDFGPSEMAHRRAIEARFRSILRTYNYREVQTPTFEELQLFLAKSGPGIRDELYDFKDKSGRELALRPELTAPVMRYYFSSLKMEPKPLRLFYFGPCYRYDRPQAGRYREFWQVGVELIGDASPAAHAEVLHLALTAFQQTGLERIRLRIGHIGILRSILRTFGVPKEEQGALLRLIDKKDIAGIRSALGAKIPAERLSTFLSLFPLADRVWTDAELFGPKAVPADPSLWQGLLDADGDAARAHVVAVLNHLNAFGVQAGKIGIDPMVARGLDYYTGLVFELDAPDLGAEKQLLGGGAYDLSGVFQEQPVDCIGFALGFDRTLVALEKAGVPAHAPAPVDALVAALAAEAWPEAARLAQTLRKEGFSVELESSPVQVKKLLSRASQLKARFAVFLGAKELERGVVAIKDLSSGTQTEAKAAEVAAKLKP